MMGCREIAENTYLHVGHTPYCPLSTPHLHRGIPRDYDQAELPIQCTCHAEGRDD